jgi:hypothetical protein
MPARVLLGTLAAVFLGSAPAQAQVFTVTSSGDTAMAPGTLRTLVDGAGNGDAILIPASVSPIALNSQIVIKKSITVAGAGAGVVSIHAGTNDRVFEISDDGASHPSVTILGVTITGGNAGAMGGGGVELDPLESLTLNEVVVTGNSTTLGFPGGGVVNNAGTLVIQRSTISGNTGGAEGGGVGALSFGTDNPTTTISDSVVSGNSTPMGRDGGGVGNIGGALAIERSTISGNTSLGSGSGVATETGGTGSDGKMSLIDSTVAGNMGPAVGRKGAGVYILVQPGHPVSLINDTIAGNTAASGPGGLEDENVPASVINTIVAGNSGEAGMENCEFIVGMDTPFVSGGHNLENGSTCGFTRPGDLSNTDPLLGPLQNNGGPTLTRAPTPSSPAIGAADPTRCPATDQRGVPYFPPNPCDIGAVDLARPAPLGPVPPPATGAAISKLGIHPATFSAAARGGSIAKRRRHVGTSVSYTQLVASKTRFVVRVQRAGVRTRSGTCVKRSKRHRHGRRCARFVKVGSFSRVAAAGPNKFHFTGRVRRHKLRPGRYRLDATATAAGKSRTLKKRFRIVR